MGRVDELECGFSSERAGEVSENGVDEVEARN